MRKKGQCFAEGGTTDAQYGTPGNVRRRQLEDAESEALGKKPRAEPPAPTKTRSISDFIFGKKDAPKKMAEGGEVREGENAGIDDTTRARARVAAEEAQTVAANREPSFKEAFAAARSAGTPGFVWKGKKFSTELAGKPAAAPPVAAEYGNEGRSAAIQSTYRSEGRNAPVAGTYRSEGRNAPVPPSYSNEGRNAKAPNVKRNKVLGSASEQRFMGAAAGGSIGFAKGGSIDGCASRGKTKAKRY